MHLEMKLISSLLIIDRHSCHATCLIIAILQTRDGAARLPHCYWHVDMPGK